MKKTLLACLALLLPVNIHSEDRDLVLAFSIVAVGLFAQLIVESFCNSTKTAAIEKTLQEIQKTQQEKEKTQQEIEKTKQLDLTIAIKKQILLNKE